MADRKAFPLRLDPAVYDALQRWAGADLRSLNAQIEFLLRRALKEAGRLPADEGPGSSRSRERRNHDHRAAVRRPEPSAFRRSWLGSVPRDVRLTSGGLAVAVTAIALAIGALVSAIVMSVVYARSESDRQLRARDSGTADADVVQIAVTRGEEPRRTRDLSLRRGRPPLHGHREAAAQRPPRPEDRRADPDRGISRHVHRRNWLTGYEPGGFPLWAIPVVALSLLLAAAAPWRERAPAVDPAVGRTGWHRRGSSARRRSAATRAPAFRVSYEFQTLSGAKQTSRCEVGKTPPPIGAVIPIVYHRDSPSGARRIRSSWCGPAVWSAEDQITITQQGQ